MDYADKQYLIALRGLAEEEEGSTKEQRENWAKELRENFEEAQKAAEGGDAEALLNLGEYHYYGFGTEEDEEEAVRWYEKAAALGSAGAMQALGWSYLKGFGVMPDEAAGYEWYKKAARAWLDAGDEVAAYYCLRGNPVDDETRVMADALLEKAFQYFDRGVSLCRSSFDTAPDDVPDYCRRAIKELDGAEARGYQGPLLYYYRGLARNGLGERRDAVLQFNHAIEIIDSQDGGGNEELAMLRDAVKTELEKDAPAAGNLIETEGTYDILQNAADEILICLRTRKGEPFEPEILYSGGKNALFHRSPRQFILLDEVHKDIREALVNAEEVLVAEFNPGDKNAETREVIHDINGAAAILIKKDDQNRRPVREYMVKIRRVVETLESIESIVEDGYPLYTALRAKLHANPDKYITEFLKEDDYAALACVLAREEDYAQLERYIAGGLSLNETAGVHFKGNWRPTPLYYITSSKIQPLMKENEKMFRWLIAHGADPNQKAGDGSTPLMNQCLSRGTAAMVKLLLEAGADPNMESKEQDCSFLPLNMAISGDDYNQVTHEFSPLTESSFNKAVLLLEHGANPNRVDDSGMLPLGQAFTYAEGERRTALVKLLLDKGADPGAALADMETWTESHFPEYSYALFEIGQPGYTGLPQDYPLGAEAQAKLEEVKGKWKDYLAKAVSLNYQPAKKAAAALGLGILDNTAPEPLDDEGRCNGEAK